MQVSATGNGKLAYAPGITYVYLRILCLGNESGSLKEQG